MNPHKTGLYHVKYIYKYKNKKLIFSHDNIHATCMLQAKEIASKHILQNTSVECIIILKRKKSNHE
jgi:hypothetical protein